jgi:tetratricopeptide (TPR) repeat protein
MRSTFAQTPAVGSGSDGTLMEVISDSHDVSKSNKFWHDFETAVYLLQIGSFRLGWSTFHTTWEKAAEAFLSSPTTLLRKLITTLTPGGKLNKFPEVLRSVLTFIAELLRLKLGGNHPLVHICQQLQLDMHGPRTSETALCLMSDMLGRRLGPLHQETFQAQLSLIVCQRLNRDLARAEDSARSLVEKLKSSPQGAGQLLQALRKLTHVLKDLGRYDEAVAIGHRILEHELNTASHELVIYTREDLAELYRLQERLYMESWCLSEALTASQQWFGHKAAPTLHIWDKLKTSLTEQRRESEIAFWEKDGYL